MMKTIVKKSTTAVLSAILLSILNGCTATDRQASTPSAQKEQTKTWPKRITVEGMALNPEGIEFDQSDDTFLLSSLNAAPIIKVSLDGSYKPFTNGEPFPMSTAGLQVDQKHNRLLAAAFNGTELMDGDPATKGTAHLRVYDLKTGALQQDVDLAALLPDAAAYFANDVVVDSAGNAYVTDWYAGVIYKVDLNGKATLFWKNDTGIKGGPNGLDFHPDGYLLVSLIRVDKKGVYRDYGLVKVPLDDASKATQVKIEDSAFRGFDGMVITKDGDVIGVTNDAKGPGGNTLVELSTQDGWSSASVPHAKAITLSTTVAVTPDGHNFVIEQDFSNAMAKRWNIREVSF